MQIKTLSATVAGLLLAAGSITASAQTITIGQASVPSASGGSAAIAVTFDDDGNVNVGAYNTEFSYSTLTGPPNYLGGIPTSNSPNCIVTDATKTVSVARFSATPGVGLPDETLCTITFAINAGTPDAAYALPHDASPGTTAFFHTDGSDITPSGTVVDGAINVVATGPGTISFPVAPVTLPNATYGTSTSANIPVNWAPGGGNNPGDTASFTCTAPAGFTVAPLSGGPYTNTGTPPANLAVSCTTGAAAVNGNVECTATNTAPSSANYTIPVTCPAGTMAPPNLTPNPASGSTLTVPSGAPGANSCQSFSIAATGGAGVNPATVTCSSADAAVVVTPATPLNFLPGAAAQSVQVCTTLTNAAQSFNNVVHCAGADGAGAIDWVFNVAAPAGAVAPTFVPASSLWSKLALFGMLGALGMLVIGLRRNH